MSPIWPPTAHTLPSWPRRRPDDEAVGPCVVLATGEGHDAYCTRGPSWALRDFQQLKGKGDAYDAHGDQQSVAHTSMC